MTAGWARPARWIGTSQSPPLGRTSHHLSICVLYNDNTVYSLSFSPYWQVAHVGASQETSDDDGHWQFHAQLKEGDDRVDVFLAKSSLNQALSALRATYCSYPQYVVQFSQSCYQHRHGLQG